MEAKTKGYSTNTSPQPNIQLDQIQNLSKPLDKKPKDQEFSLQNLQNKACEIIIPPTSERQEAKNKKQTSNKQDSQKKKFLRLIIFILIGCTILILLGVIIYLGIRVMKAPELTLTDIKRVRYPVSKEQAFVGYSFTFVDGSGHTFYTTINDSNVCSSSSDIYLNANRLLDASTNININSTTNSNNGNANTNININANTNQQTSSNNTTNNYGDTTNNNQTCQNGAAIDSAAVTVCIQQGKSGSCFPSNTVLITLEGPKLIEDIQIGDFVLTSKPQSKKQYFTQVIAWLHREPNEYSSYLKLSDSVGSLHISPLHNIALQTGSYVFAKDALGSALFGSKPIQNAQERTLKGIYAPLTDSGNFYIQTDDGRRVLVSCIANIQNPALYEKLLVYSIKAYNIFEQPHKEGIHPLATLMQRTFSFALITQ